MVLASQWASLSTVICSAATAAETNTFSRPFMYHRVLVEIRDRLRLALGSTAESLVRSWASIYILQSGMVKTGRAIRHHGIGGSSYGVDGR